MSAYGLFETGKLALPEFETSWEFCGALFSNLKGALFDSAIIWGFFDVPFSNLESALFDSGTYFGFFDALFSDLARNNHERKARRHATRNEGNGCNGRVSVISRDIGSIGALD